MPSKDESLNLGIVKIFQKDIVCLFQSIWIEKSLYANFSLAQNDLCNLIVQKVLCKTVKCCKISGYEDERHFS